MLFFCKLLFCLPTWTCVKRACLRTSCVFTGTFSSCFSAGTSVFLGQMLSSWQTSLTPMFFVTMATTWCSLSSTNLSHCDVTLDGISLQISCTWLSISSWRFKYFGKKWYENHGASIYLTNSNKCYASKMLRLPF